MGMCHMQVPLKGEFKQLCKIEKITPDCKVELHPLMSSPSDLSCVTDGNRWKSEKRNAIQETIDPPRPFSTATMLSWPSEAQGLPNDTDDGSALTMWSNELRRASMHNTRTLDVKYRSFNFRKRRHVMAVSHNIVVQVCYSGQASGPAVTVPGDKHWQTYDAIEYKTLMLFLWEKVCVAVPGSHWHYKMISFQTISHWWYSSDVLS